MMKNTVKTVLWMIVIQFSLISQVIPTFYESIPYLNGRISNEQHLIIVESSRVRCSAMCMLSSECTTFTFISKTSSCYLYAFLPTGLKNVFTLEPTAETYTKLLGYMDCSGKFVMDDTGRLCYMLIDVQQTWQDAFTSCQHMNSRLLTLESENKWLTFSAVIESGGFPVEQWLGAYDFNGTNTAWTWINGKPIGREVWFPNEPNDITERCGMIYKKTYDMNDHKCHKQCAYICERVIYNWG